MTGQTIFNAWGALTPFLISGLFSNNIVNPVWILLKEMGSSRQSFCGQTETSRRLLPSLAVLWPSFYVFLVGKLVLKFIYHWWWWHFVLIVGSTFSPNDLSWWYFVRRIHTGTLMLSRLFDCLPELSVWLRGVRDCSLNHNCSLEFVVKDTNNFVLVFRIYHER